VLRFIEGYFAPRQQSTIGAFFLTKKLAVDDVLCKLQIWDTAGNDASYQLLTITALCVQDLTIFLVCHVLATRNSAARSLFDAWTI
jgi:GTPase SAR1 family protein